MSHASSTPTQRRISGTWFIVLGLLSAALGILGFSWSVALSQFSTVFFGALLLASGAFQAVASFWLKEWGGVFLNLLLAILQVVTGALILSRPVEATLILTLVIALYLVVGGLFRVFGGLFFGFQNGTWLALSGILATTLGLIVWAQWPVSGLWFIGVAIAADLLVDGIQWLSFGIALNRSRRGRDAFSPA